MQGVVENAGNTWPQGPEQTMRDFWALLDELGEASLDELIVGPGDVVDTKGSLDDRVLWHRLLPLAPPRAWGAELRAVDSTWESHAEIITLSLRAVGGG